MKEQTENLIVLKQLPIIVEQLDKLSCKIKEEVDNALKLVVNEDTVKEIKKVRANLTKEFDELETQRKQVKNAIMEKYNQFEEIYKEKVATIYKNADLELKTKIDNVETNLKFEKESELREFYQEYTIKYDLQDMMIPFEDVGLNITLSASVKSLKEKIVSFCEKIANDVKLIQLEEYKDEIMLEFKSSLDFANSKIKVIERHKQLELIKQREEELARKKEAEAKIIEKVEEVVEEEITAPELVEKNAEEEQQMILVAFQVTATVEQIRELKQWLKERNIQYE